MSDLEKIIKFRESYIKNTKIISDYNDAVFTISNYDNWKKNLVERSNVIRNIFKENEENIASIKEIINSGLNDETANELYKTICTFNKENVHDSSIMIEIINDLILYFENDSTKYLTNLLGLYLIGGLEEMEFYLRMDSNINLFSPKEKFLKVLSFKNRYDQIENIECRRLFFLAYYNLIGPLPDLIDNYRSDSIYYYKEAIEFYNSDMVQKIDKDNEKIKQEIDFLNDVIVTGAPYYIKAKNDLKKQYFNLIDDISKFEDINSSQLELINIVRDYTFNNITAIDALDKLNNIFMDYSKGKLLYDGSEENLNVFCNCYDILNIMISILLKNEFNDKIKFKYLNPTFNILIDYIYSVPNKDFTSYFDDVSADIFKLALPFLRLENQKEEMLTKLILRRQPITYIHSIMVEKISVRIALSILSVNKKIFKDINKLGYDSDFKILKYISKAALYHDLGKCLTLGVINLQSRKLTDVEFSYIKLHPEKSLALINGDDSFKEYFDVMLGHHKYYDGKKGYPVDFDNVNSKYKSVIDLISIADSIDAATDILGRNYTVGKSFDTLLKELIKEKGTRYNPYIVNIIEKDESLKKDLSQITSNKRFDVYYDVYMQIVNKK